MTESWVELDDGVHVRRHVDLDLNVGLVVGDDECLVVDTRAHQVHGGELREAIREITAHPVRWVVNTHVHWDHTFGNASFPEARVVGHDRVREQLLAEGAAMIDRVATAAWFPDDQRDTVRAVELRPPTVTTSTELTIHCGGRPVQLVHHGRAHTDSDVVVHVADVTFMGDLVEESAPPAFGDAHPDEWAATLDRALPTLGPVVVPGHGAVVDVDFVRSQREQIDTAVRAAHGEEVVAPFPDVVVTQIRDRLRTLADGSGRAGS